MGVSEEEMLVQMVHDFIESDTSSMPTSIPSSSQAISLHHHTYLILEGMIRSATDAEMEVFEKALKYVREMGEERKKSCVKKRLMMKLRMDGYQASLCRSSWVTTLECPGGDYEYIDIVMAEENGASCRLIVDIDFRSQFELARPTSAYTKLSNILPQIFVGKEEKLKRVVSLLCSAAQQSLKERGLHIPPWRKSSYMQSKWLSCCHKASSIPYPNILSTKDLAQTARTLSSQAKDRGSRPKGTQGSGLSSQFSDLSINCC
ncbi:uncharacterized protein LOC108511650 isoform X2 [Phoenix dactylifera]|uniref:Uncharacterized protein LOC108511650 isoform X2 n=1 Tax=Phoenix dactylifera TaxID=42345 RepID=A0A8B9AEQ5_PHODC|nr:uncharacterized protein LOC108511650 isoform X2 [Phoenix dactylifera]